MSAAMLVSESADASIVIALRVIAPVLVFVTLIYIVPSVTDGPKSLRLSLVILHPVSSVNAPSEPTP